MESVEILWKLPPENTALLDNEAHVWCVDVNRASAHLNRLSELLSEDERLRASGYSFGPARLRFIVTRATLRQLLGKYLDSEPLSLKFCYGPSGKPELNCFGGTALPFSVSHSGGLGLVAVSRCGAVGVDVEVLRAAKGEMGIARRFFTARESATLAALGDDERKMSFMNLWTRKEAWLKATGQGVARSLNSAEITFLPEETPRIVSIEGDSTEADQWTLAELRPAKGFVGALAVRTRNLNVRCWRWVQ